MKMRKYILIFLAFSLGLVSCNQDLLDITQNGVVDESVYYSTDDDAMAAITVVYSQWKSVYYDSYFLTNLISDEAWCGGGTRGDNSNFEQLNEFRFSSDNPTINSTFRGYYTIIKYANTVIEKFPEDSETNTDVKDRCRAEAIAARAWAHMQLTSLWGTPPLIDHVLTGSSEYQQPNSDPDVMWDFIIKDLTAAVAVLPSKSSINAQETRLTKEAALAFKGKAQVLSGDYSGAKTTLKQVIDSGKYGLVSDMSTLFNAQGDFSEEIIFEMNTVWNPADFGFSLHHLMVQPRADHMFIPAIGAQMGWGFLNPTGEFYSAFLDHDGADSHRLDSWIKTWGEMQEMEYTGDKGLSTAFVYGNEGYFDWKYFTRAADVPVAGYGYFCEANFKIMRYAEVLLLYAEACTQAGDSDGSGLAALNAIQERAGAPTTDLTLENVKNEKRFELWLEGTRFVDLVRWGDAATVLANQGASIPKFEGVASDGSYMVDKNTYTNTYYGFKTSKHELLPFPEAETISNSNIVQNPGWTSASDE